MRFKAGRNGAARQSLSQNFQGQRLPLANAGCRSASLQRATRLPIGAEIHPHNPQQGLRLVPAHILERTRLEVLDRSRSDLCEFRQLRERKP